VIDHVNAADAVGRKAEDGGLRRISAWSGFEGVENAIWQRDHETRAKVDALVSCTPLVRDVAEIIACKDERRAREELLDSANNTDSEEAVIPFSILRPFSEELAEGDFTKYEVLMELEAHTDRVYDMDDIQAYGIHDMIMCYDR